MSVARRGVLQEGLAVKLKSQTQLLTEMGADGGCNESNIMIYLGIVEQRANELLAGYLNLQQHGHTSGVPSGEAGGASAAAGTQSSGLLVGPTTPAGMSTVSITVPTTAEDFECATVAVARSAAPRYVSTGSSRPARAPSPLAPLAPPSTYRARGRGRAPRRRASLHC